MELLNDAEKADLTIVNALITEDVLRYGRIISQGGIAVVFRSLNCQRRLV